MLFTNRCERVFNAKFKHCYLTNFYLVHVSQSNSAKNVEIEETRGDYNRKNYGIWLVLMDFFSVEVETEWKWKKWKEL